MKQMSFVLNGVRISHEDVIKYVANKLGGNHFDPRRKEDEDNYRLLDAVRERIHVLEKDVVYYELLSIGQAVVNSSDVSNLRQVLELP